MIDRSTVEHVARLARISFTEAEANRLQAEMGDILDYVEQLARVEVSEEMDAWFAEPRATGRPDEPRESLAQDEVIAQSPDPAARRHGMFVVPGVLEDRAVEDDAPPDAGEGSRS